MFHRLIKPSLQLTPYIKEYFILHLKFYNGFVAPAKPYPVCLEQGITFTVRGQVTQHKLSGAIVKVPPIAVFGQSTHRHDKKITNEFLMFQVVFQPGALYKLLRISMAELVEETIDGHAIFGREIEKVNDQLQHTNSYDEMLKIVESFLWKKVQEVKEETRAIDSIGQVILANPHQFNLDKLARDTYLSQKQFERSFVQRLGITPKFFARISRFYKAFELKEAQPNLDWLSIAWETGYGDYQHLVKDFKQFAGTTPNSLLLQNSQSPERLMGVKGLVK